jgi:uncharacterized protein YPO0396
MILIFANDMDIEKDNIIENAAALAYLNIMWINTFRERFEEYLDQHYDKTLFDLLAHAKAENKEIFERIKNLKKEKT